MHFSVYFIGLSLKHIKIIFLEGESPTLRTLKMDSADEKFKSRRRTYFKNNLWFNIYNFLVSGNEETLGERFFQRR